MSSTAPTRSATRPTSSPVVSGLPDGLEPDSIIARHFFGLRPIGPEVEKIIARLASKRGAGS